MNIEITGQTVAIITVSIAAVVGWVLAYLEYEKSSKAVIATKACKDLEAAQHSTAIQLAEERRHTEVKNLKAEIEDIKTAHSIELSAALETRESELVEAEALVRNRINEIESVYRSAIDEQNETLELYERYIKNFDAALTLSDKKIKDLDIKGLFSSDDEIGFFFTTVSGLQAALNHFKIDKEVLDTKHAEQTKD